ncbi:MAG: hypothetical protein RBR22_13640 [Desulfuromonas sp.]|nr:hypothetical protein [Desulfuromonas sp.]
MINKFITAPHSADTLKSLDLRAVQLVTGFFNDSTDEGLKSRIYERYLGQIDDSLSLTTDRAALDQIFLNLKNHKQITESQAEAFLCVSSDQNRMMRWQALIFVVSLEHMRLFENTDRVLRAMSDFRRLLQDKKDNKKLQEIITIESSIPDPLQSLDQIVMRLSRFLEQVPKSQKIYIHQRLLSIRRILADVNEEKLKNQRSRETQNNDEREINQQEPELHAEGADVRSSPVKRGRYNATIEAARVDDEDAAHAVMRESPDTTHNTLNEAEFASDNATERSYIALAPDSSTPPSLRRSFMLSAVHAKTVAGHIERNEKRLVTAMSQLTRHDIHCLKEALQQKADTQPAIVFLIHLMLVTGRRLEQVLRARNIDHASDLKQSGDAIILQQNGDMYWVYRADLPQHQLDGNLKLFIDRQVSPVILPLPPPPKNSYMLALPPLTADIQQEAISFIDEINCVNKTRLTCNRIAAFLSDFLHQRGVDDVVNALVTGNPSIQDAGTYYYQYENKTVFAAYELFLSEFFAVEIEGFKKEALTRHKGGSQLIVKPEVVSTLFEYLESKTQVSKGDIAEFHNAYTYYILHLLNFATGHRPVRDPFDDLEHIDLANKKIFISDKESRQTASSARVLRLPETAIKQIQMYIEHLKELQLQLFVINPDAANAVARTLAGKNRLLFLFEENDADIYQIQPLSPKAVQEYLGALFNIPANWHRHYLRTFLSRNTVPGELIDAWMGHAKLGQEGYNQFSGLSMEYVWLISNKIEREMNKLGIKSIAGWGAGKKE